MIRITIKHSENRIRGVRIKGHAEAAEHGRDIVCAAVSVLAQTVLLSIVDQIGREIPHRMSSGNLVFDVPEDLSEEESIRTDALMRALCLGLTDLSESYREYIKITKEEV